MKTWRSYKSQRKKMHLLIVRPTKTSISLRSLYVRMKKHRIQNHYENTPIQIYWKFYYQKNENYRIKNSDIFHISAQNIDCGYSLEPPRWGGSNEYPQSMFLE